MSNLFIPNFNIMTKCLLFVRRLSQLFKKGLRYRFSVFFLNRSLTSRPLILKPNVKSTKFLCIFFKLRYLIDDVSCGTLPSRQRPGKSMTQQMTESDIMPFLIQGQHCISMKSFRIRLIKDIRRNIYCSIEVLEDCLVSMRFYSK